MNSFDLTKFKRAIAAERIEWRKHVLQRLVEREILQQSVLEVLQVGDCIEEYPSDKPFPSALFLGYTGSKPLHVVAAFDESNEQAYVITAYEPSLDVFESDHRTRRSR